MVPVKLYAGAARENITPEIGGYMVGYNPERRSTDVADDLALTAVALSQGDSKVLLVGLDLCLIDDDDCDRIRALVGNAAGLDPRNVILNCSHTHSGPTTCGGYHMRDYFENDVIPKCIAAGKSAVAALRPVTMGVAAVDSLTGINRREVKRDGSVVLGRNPWGVLDKAMTVIAFQSEDGTPVANIVHYGAHPTAAGAINDAGPCTTITRDWPGVMTDRLDAFTGALTVFLNGAGGDIAPRLANATSRRGDMGHVREVGAVAAMDAFRAYTGIKTFYDEPLTVAHGEIRVPLEPAPPFDAGTMDPSRMLLHPSTTPRVKQAWETYMNGENPGDEFSFTQTLIRIGPVVLVPFPFETCTGVSARLRQYSKFQHTLVLGTTNGNNLYLPTQDQMALGGYEVDLFRKRPKLLPQDTDTRMINQNLDLMESL